MVQTPARPSRAKRPPAAEDTPQPAPEPAHRTPRSRVGAAVFAVVFVLAMVLVARLGAQEAGGPPHVPVVVGDGIPATLYVPGTVSDRSFQPLPDPRPVGSRPPVVVLAHGFSADHATMSTLARSLAANGYAVVAFDFRGHGGNRHPFPEGFDTLRRDVAAAVDWTQTSAYVDPRRVVVVGHSMGAATVVDFATRDRRPAGVVAISGSRALEGPYRPPNALFLVAQRDPSYIGRHVDHIVRQLAGATAVRGRTYGSIAAGTAVRAVRIGGTDHITVLSSGAAVREIVSWMDQIFGVTRTAPVGRVDARLGTAGLYLLCCLALLYGIGLLAGRRVPRTATAAGGGALGGLLVLAVGLVATMPLLATGAPGAFLSLAAGDAIVSHLALAGAVILLAGILARPDGVLARASAGRITLPVPRMADLRVAALPVALASAAVYALFVPLSGVFHRLVPTPERLVAGLVAAALMLPFFLAFEWLVRRGSLGRAALTAAGGRLVLLVALFLGVSVGWLPGVVVIYLPILVGLSIFFEIFAAGVYGAGGSIVVIAAVETVWLAWLTAVTMPIG